MSSPVTTPHPAHENSHKDYEGAKLGMWLFLFTEILLFGGLFILYSAYRARYPLEFHEGDAGVRGLRAHRILAIYRRHLVPLTV